jgi:hypothetical protein
MHSVGNPHATIPSYASRALAWLLRMVPASCCLHLVSAERKGHLAAVVLWQLILVVNKHPRVVQHCATLSATVHNNALMLLELPQYMVLSSEPQIP